MPNRITSCARLIVEDDDIDCLFYPYHTDAKRDLLDCLQQDFSIKPSDFELVGAETVRNLLLSSQAYRVYIRARIALKGPLPGQEALLVLRACCSPAANLFSRLSAMCPPEPELDDGIMILGLIKSLMAGVSETPTLSWQTVNQLRVWCL